MSKIRKTIFTWFHYEIKNQAKLNNILISYAYICDNIFKAKKESSIKFNIVISSRERQD